MYNDDLPLPDVDSSTNRINGPGYNQAHSQHARIYLQDYVKLLRLVFGVCGLFFKSKLLSWAAAICTCISFADTGNNEDKTLSLGSVVTAISAIMMSHRDDRSIYVPPSIFTFLDVFAFVLCCIAIIDHYQRHGY